MMKRIVIIGLDGVPFEMIESLAHTGIMPNTNQLIENSTFKKTGSCIHYRNYPNPFNAETEIRFTITEPGLVAIKIYNSLGMEVATLTEQDYPAGSHSITWNGRNKNDKSVSSGIYFYSITFSGSVKTGKMILIK